MFKPRLIEAAVTAGLALATAGCGGGHQNWYANGKAFEIAWEHAQGNVRVVTPDVQSALVKQAWTNLRENGIPASTSGGYSFPAIPGNAPAPDSGAPARQWVAGAVAGYYSIHPGQAPASQPAQQVQPTQTEPATHPAAGTGYRNMGTLGHAVRAWLQARVSNPHSSFWTESPPIKFIPGVKVTSMVCLTTSDEVATYGSSGPSAAGDGPNIFVCNSTLSDASLSGWYIVHVSADGSSWAWVHDG